MVDCWFLSDPHLGHEKTITTFKRHDGSPLRDFESVSHMHEVMFDNCHRLVKPQDHLYLMGDMVINKKFLPLLKRFPGHLRMLGGNHDIFHTKDYLPYFEEIRAVRVMDNVCFTHFPIHPDCMARYAGNAHGHLHHQPRQLGKQYLNLSCEMIDYTPWSLEQVKKHFGV
jgi:calcineurin-like phosphoesterase family protein